MPDVADAGNANALPQKPGKSALDIPASGFPERYIVFGVFVGLFLTLLGVGILALGPLWSLGSTGSAAALTICVGFGIILAAFGARASGTWAGWSAAGAGAMAALLFLLLQKFSPTPAVELVKGSLEGDFSKVAELRIIDENPMYVYRDNGTSTINFLYLNKELLSHRIRLQVDTVEREAGNDYFQLIGDARLIKKIRLKNAGHILWTFDYGNRRVMDGADVIFSERGTILGPENAPSEQATRAWWSLAAYAQEMKDSLYDPAIIAKSIGDLQSEDSAIRRIARETLAGAGPDAVAPLLQTWRQHPDDYFIKLGATYALTEMIQNKARSPGAISSQITAEDFPLLVGAASDSNKTIRYQAAEFLYLLGDPRAINLSLEATKQASDAAVLTNQILILKQAGQNLPDIDKEGIINELDVYSKSGNSKLAPNADFNDFLKW
jgi:hypothetical protein